MAGRAGRAAGSTGVRASAARPGERNDLADALEPRLKAGSEFFGLHAWALARLCHRLAERFARGGRLIALGASAAARSDARHVAVEFVHPVIVGKRALPAIGLTEELTNQVKLLAAPEDIVIAFGTEDDGELPEAVQLARARGCLTIGFSAIGAEHQFEPPTSDPFIGQELVETLYHVLWELVHVFFEHRGLLEGRQDRSTHDSGASAFLYPFLADQEHDLEAVIADVQRSVEMKSDEIAVLRSQTLTEEHSKLRRAAAAARGRLASHGKLLALGNGGSATDATDLVADLRVPPLGRSSWPAIDLTADAAILTAVANDVGVHAMFSRQVIAYGQPGDVLVTLSTSGNSLNVIEALAQARKREMTTIAFAGYDGGRIAAESLADHVIVTRSEHIPRIQEAQASAYHVLREMLG
jgi:D-sedoheptulose 7-phosphate isomerase